jgi:hypothetical protein
MRDNTQKEEPVMSPPRESTCTVKPSQPALKCGETWILWKAGEVEFRSIIKRNRLGFLENTHLEAMYLYITC